jgi:hypothetical protein
MKNALFVFNGNPMCFVHVLLNALDMKARGIETRIVLEGESVKLVPELARAESPLNGLWLKARQEDLVEGVCMACAKKLGTFEDAKGQGLALLADMSGHAGMAAFQEKGFTIITF